MTNDALSRIEASFTAWCMAEPPDEQSFGAAQHVPDCQDAACAVVRPAFPILEVHAQCSGDIALVPVALFWPTAVRGPTRRLRTTLHRAWELAVALRYELLVSPDPVPAASELFDDHVIRLPMSPGVVNSRADVHTALTRTVGAIGWGVTDGRTAFPALAETVARVSSLVLLDLLGVDVRWDALIWHSKTARQLKKEEVEAARATLHAAVSRLARVAGADA